ncbi:MAG: aminotransferase class III-fold pyridoxal phosphate-dependent enzyme, partial [Pseudomonadota bacterium]
DGIRALCDSHGWLMILDEIQTGMGRTGKWFAHQHGDCVPDIMTLAKGLGNGVPIGACLARGAAAELFGPGNHGSTFGGNPLACRAALAVMETLAEEKLVENAANQGRRMLEALREGLAGQPGVTEVRGLGLMLGIELDRPCAALVTTALEQGLILNVTAERVIRLIPPLIIGDAEANEIVDRVSSLVTDFLASEAA